ncbi:MAG: VWA domain-containing protein [Bryobacteraceae bacterium]
MRIRNILLWMGALLAGAGAAGAQKVEQTSTPTVIRSETKLVLVDAVVTDKKGNYITDLTQKDFEVLEDNKKQSVKTFGFEADPNSPQNNQKRYLVLFFDNASAGYGDQIQARQAAAKFIDGNTGPNKYIAIANFTGTLRITQNFTNDPERLKAVVSGVKMATVSTTSDASGMGSAGGGFPNMNTAAADFGVRSVLLALRSLAKGLESVPGRKTLIMLTAGFPLTSEARAELTVTIDACNHANVAVYPLDVRGLVTTTPNMQPGSPIIREDPMALVRSPGSRGSSLFRLASFSNSFAEPSQATRGGGGGGSTGGGTTGGSTGGGGSRTGGSTGGSTGSSGGSTGSTGGSRGGSTGGTGTGTTGSRGGTTGNTGGGGTTTTNPSLNNRNLLNMNPRSIVPPFPPGMGINDSALYMLADGTGGFVIHDTNDLLSGMEKIARDQNQYYILGYSPEDSPEGSCHALKVKVDRGGSSVRSRSGYCNVRVVDALAGKPAETELEAIAAGSAAGSIAAPLQLPFFYSSPNVARVNVAMEIPAKTFHFEKVKGKQHAEVNVLGVAYKPDGSVGAKFSDTIKLDFDGKAQVEEFQTKPLHYENQFEIASGTYSFKVIFSGGGQDFGKLEKPLTIDPFDGKQFALSGLALSHDRLSTEGDAGLDSVLIEDKVPLLSGRMQFIPAGSSLFKITESMPGLYLEIYEPHLLDETAPRLAIWLKVSDRQGGQLKIDSGLVPMEAYVRKGNPVVPVGLKLPVAGLVAGAYRLELTALDSMGKSVTRSVDFDVE